MVCKTCNFVTSRLVVREGDSLPAHQWTPQELPDVVKAFLTSRVTRSLPEAWQGTYTVERARNWITERDREGATLLAVEQSSRMAVGLIILLEMDHEKEAGTEVRLGYVLAESAWGKGFASEMVQGFVEWCRKTDVALIVGGVDRDNVPSRRVLEKNGFVRVPGTEGGTEQLFQLRLLPQKSCSEPPN